MRVIFIDGYNVINSWPNLKKSKNYSYDIARTELTEMLENYAAFNSCKIYLVFDAHKVAGNIESKELSGNIITVFTKEGEIADAYIERMVDELGRKVEIVVVTSDRLEQQTIFQRGAVRMSSIEFYNEVLKVQDNIRKKAEKNKLELGKNFLGDTLEESVLEKLEKMLFLEIKKDSKINEYKFKENIYMPVSSEKIVNKANYTIFAIK